MSAEWRAGAAAIPVVNGQEFPYFVFTGFLYRQERRLNDLGGRDVGVDAPAAAIHDSPVSGIAFAFVVVVPHRTRLQVQAEIILPAKQQDIAHRLDIVQDGRYAFYRLLVLQVVLRDAMAAVRELDTGRQRHWNLASVELRQRGRAGAAWIDFMNVFGVHIRIREPGNVQTEGCILNLRHVKKSGLLTRES